MGTAEKKVPSRHPLQRLNKLNKLPIGDQNSTETLVVSSVVLSFADFTMRPANTVGPESDVMLTVPQRTRMRPVFAGTIKITQSAVFSRSPEVSQNGLNDMSKNVSSSPPNRLTE